MPPERRRRLTVALGASVGAAVAFGLGWWLRCRVRPCASAGPSDCPGPTTAQIEDAMRARCAAPRWWDPAARTCYAPYGPE